MERISVVGTSGSGKTTLSKQLAKTLSARHIELDALHFEPGWNQVSAEEMRRRVDEATEGTTRAANGNPTWVADGNYHNKTDLLAWQKADTVVWIDLPRWRIITRVARRTFWRALTRRELWNGCREGWAGLAFWREPEDSIVRWAWDSFPGNRERYEGAMSDPRWAHLTFVRLRSPREVASFLRSVEQASGG